MRLIEDNFKYKGVTFEIVRRGSKALLLKAIAPFYPDDCVSYEVWQLRYSKDSEIQGVAVAGGERKPSNEDYPYCAHQFMSYLHDSEEAMMEKVEKRYYEYETGVRPKPKLEL